MRGVTDVPAADARAKRFPLLDLALAAGTAAGLTLLVVLGLGGDRPADPLAYGFTLGLGAILLLRRQIPRIVLALSILALFAYYARDYPAIGVAIPVLAAVFSAAERGAVGWSIGGSVLVLAASAWFRYRAGEELDYLIGHETVSNLAMLGAAITSGTLVRARRERAAQQEEIDRLTAERSAAAIRSAEAAERARLSRELHDTVGHALTVISMHASVGEESLERDTAAAATSLAHIRETANSSLRETRSLLRAIAPPEGHEVHGLADAGALLDRVRGGGLAVDAELDLPDPLPVAASRAGYRILQEALTNAVRHGHARTATVRAWADSDVLRLRISDDGSGTSGPVTPGQGITGMRERARLLGGEIRAYGGPDGFTVEADLPMGVQR